MAHDLDYYFDYAATTPPDPAVIGAMVEAMESAWGNGGSPNRMGRQGGKAVEEALNVIAHFLKIERNELIITSGATESINQAIKGVMLSGKKRHIITSTIEHKATLQTVQALMKRGYRATFLSPNEAGMITAEMVDAAIEPETGIISLIWVNNETGDTLPAESIAAVARQHKIPIHLDATQAAPHLPIDAGQVDLLSMSSHKCYGPKGVGLLYKRHFPRLPLTPLMDGSGGQLGIRSGTMPNELVIGFAKALQLLSKHFEEASAQSSHFAQTILEALAPYGVTRNGGKGEAIDATLSLHIPHVHADALIAALPEISLAKGSACSSDSRLPSHVLTELGYSDRHALQSIRLSVGRFTTAKAVDYLIRRFQQVIPLLQAVAKGEDQASDYGAISSHYPITYLSATEQTIDGSIEKRHETSERLRVEWEEAAASIVLELELEKEHIVGVTRRVMGEPLMIALVEALKTELVGMERAAVNQLSFEAILQSVWGTVPPSHLSSILGLERATKAVLNRSPAKEDSPPL